MEINIREIFLSAVKGSGYALKYASDEMKNDKEIVLEALKQDGLAWDFASRRLQDEFLEKGLKKIEKRIEKYQKQKRKDILII